MSRVYNLSIAQQKIVRDVVRILENDNILTCFWGYMPGQVSFAEKDITVPASLADVRVIASQGLFELSNQSSRGTAVLSVQADAVAAVQSNFGLRKRDTILRAVYDLAGADVDVAVKRSAIVAATGLTEKEVDNHAEILHGANLVRVIGPLISQVYAASTPVRETEYSLTPAGVEAAEHPPQTQQPHSVTNVHAQNVANVNAGSHSSANVVQNIGTGLAEILEAIEMVRASAAELPAVDREEVNETLAVLEEEAKKNTLSPSKIKICLRALGTFVVKAPGIAVAILTFGEKTGLSEYVRRLPQLLHPKP